MSAQPCVETRPSDAFLVPPGSRETAPLVARLRELAFAGLTRMYVPEDRLFVFRLRRAGTGLIGEGRSHRYTAIALIGLAGEEASRAQEVLAGHDCRQVCMRLLGDVDRLERVGDVALVLWAAQAVGGLDPTPAWHRLHMLRPWEGVQPTVEVAWALAATCLGGGEAAADVRVRLAERLTASASDAGLFPHTLGGSRSALRSHVSCFADLVYPVHALAMYARLSGHERALSASLRCARVLRTLQGGDGQWWWHYDNRNGRVIEHYPVYAVHQDAMAPLALGAVARASGEDFGLPITQGLAWLAQAPELGGASLVDLQAGLIWRKVARREPGKLSRYLQSAASALHPRLRAPGLHRLFPPRSVDHEDRPYHLGWLLHVWPPSRAVKSPAGAA